MDMFWEWLQTTPWVMSLLILCCAILAATLVGTVGTRVLTSITGRTQTNLDDQVVEVLQRPVVMSFLLIGIWYAFRNLGLGGDVEETALAICQSVAVLYWGIGGWRAGEAVLKVACRRKLSMVRPRTLPVFDIALKFVVLGLCTYFFLLAWSVDLTAWLASAGVVGVVVGLAAQDSLSNLFAGLFILADAPYKLGDTLDLGTGVRGKVTDIGLRSTRILTRDDVEIIIPNAQIAAAQVINETGGPIRMTRASSSIGVAYGSDVDQVRAVLLECAGGVAGIALEGAYQPQVRFVAFGASSLDFLVLVWLRDPEQRLEVLDDLNTRIYKSLNGAEIEIPFPKQDLYLRGVDSRVAAALTERGDS